jgi:type IV pilus assembly protein PilB
MTTMGLSHHFGASDDAPLVHYLQRLIEQAEGLLASDIHFEPYEQTYRVRMRVDGQLREVSAPPPQLKERIATRLKVLARLDIAEKRLPQDGRLQLTVAASRLLDLRISTLPTLHGEKLVVRLLDNRASDWSLQELGYAPEELARLLQAIERPDGLVLVTGPTGSGKTQSLYACLQHLNRPELNISTVEDPCEISMAGINQVNVHDKPGLGFAIALRAFLRQDPDVLMVGEIRDLETAEIAIQAAQTGHLVLSTLHTRNAVSALTRLRNMGIAPYNLASSVTLVSAQRLVRKLCKHCRQEDPAALLHLQQAAPHLLDCAIESAAFRADPRGCDSCHRGYSGRIGLFEVMPVQSDMQAQLMQSADEQTLSRLARQSGVCSLRQAGWRRVLQGLTALDEVLANTPET